jgi:hypothetical protein
MAVKNLPTLIISEPDTLCAHNDPGVTFKLTIAGIWHPVSI